MLVYFSSPVIVALLLFLAQLIFLLDAISGEREREVGEGGRGREGEGG